MRLVCPIVRGEIRVALTTEQVRDIVATGSQALAAAGFPSPVREARRLFALAAGSRSASAGGGDHGAWVAGRRYRLLLAARFRRVPFPMLEGETGFLDFDVAVRPGVFIPRPETEELAERAISVLLTLPPHPRVLDLGTGTGALALALARARADARVVAVDVSPRALACARRNARSLGVKDRLEVRRSDWFSSVSERFHLIVANPPYIARSDLASLDPEVREFEPRRALDGGPDGMSAICHILSQASTHLLPGGTVLVEIGGGQAREVLRFAREGLPLVETGVERDLSGKERFFIGQCA